MATVSHQIQYWTWTIPPSQSLWLSYGPSEAYKTGTVQVACCPSTSLPGNRIGNVTLDVPVVYITQIPTRDGDIVLEDCYAGFNIVNGGQETVQYFSVAISIVGP